MRDYLRRTRAERSPELVAKIRALMDDYGSITFTGEYAEGILLVAEEYFEQAFADAQTRTGSRLPPVARALRLGQVALSSGPVNANASASINRRPR